MRLKKIREQDKSCLSRAGDSSFHKYPSTDELHMRRYKKNGWTKKEELKIFTFDSVED